MEVRIKEGNGYVDADWTIEDGVMVVSPVVKFEPKDGNVIVSGGDVRFVAIFKAMKEEYSFYYYSLLVLEGDKRPQINNWASFLNVRPATEEEKKKLFDRLAEEGYSWNAERKELVKLKWKPKEGEDVFIPKFIIENGFGFYFEPQKQTMRNELQIYLNKGMCFKTKEECKSFCGELNRVINSVES